MAANTFREKIQDIGAFISIVGFFSGINVSDVAREKLDLSIDKYTHSVRKEIRLIELSENETQARRDREKEKEKEKRFERLMAFKELSLALRRGTNVQINIGEEEIHKAVQFFLNRHEQATMKEEKDEKKMESKLNSKVLSGLKLLIGPLHRR